MQKEQEQLDPPSVLHSESDQKSLEDYDMSKYGDFEKIILPGEGFEFARTCNLMHWYMCPDIISNEFKFGDLMGSIGEMIAKRGKFLFFFLPSQMEEFTVFRSHLHFHAKKHDPKIQAEDIDTYLVKGAALDWGQKGLVKQYIFRNPGRPDAAGFVLLDAPATFFIGLKEQELREVCSRLRYELENHKLV